MELQVKCPWSFELTSVQSPGDKTSFRAVMWNVNTLSMQCWSLFSNVSFCASDRSTKDNNLYKTDTLRTYNGIAHVKLIVFKFWGFFLGRGGGGGCLNLQFIVKNKFHVRKVNNNFPQNLDLQKVQAPDACVRWARPYYWKARSRDLHNTSLACTAKTTQLQRSRQTLYGKNFSEEEEAGEVLEAGSDPAWVLKTSKETLESPATKVSSW